MTQQINGESFQDFKNSFSYGSRTDLSFKFLKSLSDEDAAKFFQELLWKLGDTLDDGDLVRLARHVYKAQVRAYAGESRWSYEQGPFRRLETPVSESRLLLLTSTGHFVKGNDPEPFGVKNMSQEEATARIAEFLQTEPQLSIVPMDTPKESLQVRHGGYDIRGVQADPNVAFPCQRLLELEEEGIIGELASDAYSFIGACAQTRLLKHTGPKWVEMLKGNEIDAALLVPV